MGIICGLVFIHVQCDLAYSNPWTESELECPFFRSLAPSSVPSIHHLLLIFLYADTVLLISSPTQA